MQHVSTSKHELSIQLYALQASTKYLLLICICVLGGMQVYVYDVA